MKQTTKQTIQHIKHICKLLGYEIKNYNENITFRIYNKSKKENIISSQIVNFSNKNVSFICVSSDKDGLYALYTIEGGKE